MPLLNVKGNEVKKRWTKPSKRKIQLLINQQRLAVKQADADSRLIRKDVTDLMLKNDKKAAINDNNYIFLSFVTAIPAQRFDWLIDRHYLFGIHGINGQRIELFGLYQLWWTFTKG